MDHRVEGPGGALAVAVGDGALAAAVGDGALAAAVGDGAHSAITDASQLNETDPKASGRAKKRARSKGKKKGIPDMSTLSTFICETKLISFLGKQYRIVLHENESCYLIATISNFLILRGTITLPNSTQVSLEKLAEHIYTVLKNKIKDDDLLAVAATTLEAAVNGLDMDIYITSMDGFVENKQYQIFKSLGIPIYHSCLLNLDLEEDVAILDVCDGKSYDDLVSAYSRSQWKKEALTSTQLARYELMSRFLRDAGDLSTDHGFFILKKNTNDKDLFVFYWDFNLHIIYKENGTFYKLQKDAGDQNMKNAWMAFNDLNGDGEEFEDVVLRIAPEDMTQISPVPIESGSSPPLPEEEDRDNLASVEFKNTQLLDEEEQKLVACPDPSFAVADPPPQGPQAEELNPFSSLHDMFCNTKVISFMGRKYKILLQERDGPCSLIAISNFLVLKERITLPDSSRVCLMNVAELVYTEVFKNMKNDEYSEIVDTLKKTASGLDVDILFSSVDGFDETSHYRIFRTLDIPLYHSCVLDLNLEQDSLTYDAIDGRSFDQLSFDYAKDLSMINGEGSSSVMSVLEKEKFDRIVNFHKKVSLTQSTDYGFRTLKQNTSDGELFVFFWRNHFSLIFKENGTFYCLQTNLHYRNSKMAWQVYDNLNGGGDMLEDVSKMSNIGNYHDSRTAPKVLGKTKGTNSSKSVQKSNLPKPVEKTPLPGSHLKAQFASFFTGSEDERFGSKFLEFLRSYKENDTVYYEPIISAMKQMGCQEYFVLYKHLHAVNPEFARSLSMCYERVRNNLSNALQTFIREDLNDPDFHAYITVHICDMPKPERWVPAKELFRLDGCHPSEARTISCADSTLDVAQTTPIGRISLMNLLLKLSANHSDGKSWNGQFTLDQILFNDELKAHISAPLCPKTTRSTRQLDFVRVATDFLPLYAVDGQLPGFFGHLEQSLRSYIDDLRFGVSMMQKFNKFITAHPALKAPLVRLAVVDNIYTAHQSLTKGAKRYLQSILDCNLLEWTNPLKQKKPSVSAVHWVVYNHYINTRNAEKEDDEDSEPCETTLEAGMIFLRHVRHHGAEGAIDEKGDQQLEKLSDLDLLNAYVFNGLLPAILEQLILYADDCADDDLEAYIELSGWLDELLEKYCFPELHRS